MNSGKPTLRPWDEVGLEEIGGEGELSSLAAVEDQEAARLAGLGTAPPPAAAAAADAAAAEVESDSGDAGDAAAAVRQPAPS